MTDLYDIFAFTRADIARKRKPAKKIKVVQLPNEHDWTFVLVDSGKGVKRLTVF